MPPKRQSFLDKLEQELPAAPDTDANAIEAVAVKNTSTPSARPDLLKTTIYIPKNVARRLREIAYTEQCKMHDLMMEGLDRVIENRGHPERVGKSKTS